MVGTVSVSWEKCLILDFLQYIFISKRIWVEITAYIEVY
jgi:hypothetical protein